MQSTLGFYYAIPFKMKESLQNAFQGNSFLGFFALIRVTLYPHASQYVSTMFMVDEDGCNAISCVFTTSSHGSRFDILWWQWHFSYWLCLLVFHFTGTCPLN